MRLTRSTMLYPVWNDPIDQISSFLSNLENRYLSKQKDDGHTKISISIILSGPNIQNSISDSYSAELTIDSQKEASELIDLFAKGMDTVFSKGTSGPTETKDKSPSNG